VVVNVDIERMGIRIGDLVRMDGSEGVVEVLKDLPSV